MVTVFTSCYHGKRVYLLVKVETIIVGVGRKGGHCPRQVHCKASKSAGKCPTENLVMC